MLRSHWQLSHCYGNIDNSPIACCPYTYGMKDMYCPCCLAIRSIQCLNNSRPYTSQRITSQIGANNGAFDHRHMPEMHMLLSYQTLQNIVGSQPVLTGNNKRSSRPPPQGLTWTISDTQFIIVTHCYFHHENLLKYIFGRLLWKTHCTVSTCQCPEKCV